MKKSLLLGSMLAFATMMGSASVLAQTTVVQPAPAQVVVTKERGSAGYPGLTWGGLTIWGLSYGAAAVGGAIANDACDASSNLCIKNRGVMFVPVFGPWIAAAGVEGIKGTATVQTLLILDGAFQAGGLAMMISGIVLSAQANRTRAAIAPKPQPEKKFTIVPYTTPTFAGLGAVGRF